MAGFKRGIKNQDFINAMNKLYQDKSSFWYKMVHDKDLFIAIRKEYLNVYFKGQSMCRIFFNKGFVLSETHKKYLGFRENGYFRSNNGIFLKPNTIIKNLSEIESIKKNVINYIGKEKSESYKEVMDRDKNIIRVGWAKMHLLKAGLLESPRRSIFKITEKGHNVLNQNL